MSQIYLGSEHRKRSASEISGGDYMAAYQGICLKCPRPVKVDGHGDGSELPRYATIRCMDCATPLRGERLISVKTDLECDSSCMCAWGHICHCGCDGANHANVWGKRLRESEVLEGEIIKWKAHVADTERRREQRKIEKADAAAAELATRPSTPGQLGEIADLCRTRAVPEDIKQSVIWIISEVSSGSTMLYTDVEEVIGQLKKCMFVRAGRSW